jgi:hypothetical protein
MSSSVDIISVIISFSRLVIKAVNRLSSVCNHKVEFWVVKVCSVFKLFPNEDVESVGHESRSHVTDSVLKEDTIRQCKNSDYQAQSQPSHFHFHHRHS